jgi:cell division protein ZapA
MTKKTISIKLLNKHYEVKCSLEEIDSLQTSAKYLNAKMAEIKQQFKHLDQNQSLLLAALNLGHELHQSNLQKDESLKKLNRIMNSLEARINKTLALEE